MAADGARPLAPEKGQRTLFSLQKVVRLDTSAVCFSQEAVHDLKKILQDPASPKYVLLTTLRKLDCFRLEFNDLVTTEIGSAVATLAAHPKLEVSRLAAGLVTKWRALIESTVFKQLPYDSELASTIPEDPPAPPPPPPGQAAATQQQQAADRKAQQELRRQQELDFLDSDDDIEEPSSDEDTDEDWRPGRGAKRSAGKRKQKSKG